jgi:2,3-bisphosphoglycerate-dependent phosphoglycerate mutase
MATLILLRHGESDWNQKNLFTGWVDVDLTEKGEEQARLGGLELKKAGLLPTVVHTSVQTRAVRTANLALEACDRSWIPVRRHWRLNERHYGALQGLDKTATREKYGDEQFMLWRRSYDVPPPPIELGSEWDVSSDERYRLLTRDIVPRAECLADVVHRMLPYWYDAIVPDLRAGEQVLVAAHGNSLRALVAHLDGLSKEEVVGLNIPTGQPLRYDLDDDLQPVTKGGAYLDPEAAAAAAAAVAAQGQAPKQA